MIPNSKPCHKQYNAVQKLLLRPQGKAKDVHSCFSRDRPRRQEELTFALRILPAPIVRKACLQLKSGERVEGIVISAKPGPEGGYVLGDVKPIANKESNGPTAPLPFR